MLVGVGVFDIRWNRGFVFVPMVFVVCMCVLMFDGLVAVAMPMVLV